MIFSPNHSRREYKTLNSKKKDINGYTK